jgi:hypothetical protein
VTYIPQTIEKIAQTILTGSAASFDFTSIPGTYENLRLEFILTTDSGTSPETLKLRFNNDSGANYNSQWSGAFASTNARNAASAAATSAQVCEIPGNSGSSNGTLAVGEVKIASYARTTLNKMATTRGGHRYDNTNLNVMVSNGMIEWKSSAAITRITIFPTAGNLLAGSVATLYGERS